MFELLKAIFLSIRKFVVVTAEKSFIKPYKRIKRRIKRAGVLKRSIKRKGIRSTFKKIFRRKVDKLWDKRSPDQISKFVLRKFHSKINSYARLIDAINDILRYKTVHKIKIFEVIMSYIKDPRLLQLATAKELKELTKMINKQLKEFGLDPLLIEDMNKDDVIKAAYQIFLYNWKTKFFNSDVMAEGEIIEGDAKNQLWEEIENNYTFKNELDPTWII